MISFLFLFSREVGIQMDTISSLILVFCCRGVGWDSGRLHDVKLGKALKVPKLRLLHTTKCPASLEIPPNHRSDPSSTPQPCNIFSSFSCLPLCFNSILNFV